MADESAFGGDTAFGAGSGISAGFGGGPAATADMTGADAPPDVPQSPQTPAAPPPSGFGANLRGMLGGANYKTPDPASSALDQSADLLQQRINRASQISTNPVLQFFNPEGVQAARAFVPKAAEELQKIQTQKAAIQAGHQQADTLGLAPGEVSDQATQADRVEVARARALKGDMRVFQGLQAVDPKTAEAIAPQVHEAVAAHLTNAQTAFEGLSGARNQGQYEAKLQELRKNGTLTDLEALGLKVPPSFEAFGASKGREGQALRDARIAVDSVRQKLEERNTYQPMEEKEAKTYNGRLTTAYGDQITNGTWSRNGAAGTRGLVVNGAADPRELGKSFTLATPEQRKALEEESDKVIPKEEREKYRAFNRTYQLATTNAKGEAMPPGTINTNPNVQQGIAEGLASMLRGGSGGANIGLLKIETSKRGFIQGLIDKISTEKGAVINELKGKDVNPYLSTLTQQQVRDVMDVLKQYNDTSIGDRASKIAERAGALGLDVAAIGYGDKETAGAINAAIERGRSAQIERMMPNHQAIGGGDGVFQLGAQRPGVGATGTPNGTGPTTQLPGAPALQTPVQQAQGAPAPPQPGAPAGGPAGPSSPAPGAAPPAPGPGPVGGGPAPVQPQPVTPMTIAGQQISVPTPPGISPNFVPALQRIESGREKNPWTATSGNGPNGKPLSSASGAFQMIDSTWNAVKPAGAPDRAKDATPEQQSQAFATLIAKNAASLQSAGLPVNDTSLYIAHDLGAGGAANLLRADPNADARTVVGETAARNNSTFFKGRPTVATALARYQAEMDKTPEPDGPKPKPGAGGATAEAPGGFMSRVRNWLSAGAAPEGSPNPSDASLSAAQRAEATQAAASAAPAAMSTAGAVAGSVAGPAGTVAGGAAGGAAGQSVKDFLQGRPQSGAAIAKEAALGGVLGVAPAGRPFLGAVTRAAGAGAVEGGAKAIEGGDTGDVAEAAAGGVTSAATGEAFGRALGMVGHKVWNMFAPDAKKAVQTAASKYADATKVLETESPKLPGAGGAAGGPNPKYEAAEKARTDAETVLKDAGLKPEEAAYAHKVSSEGVPKQEAEASRPGGLEEQRLGKGYDRLTQAVDETGVGAVRATPKLADGPRAAVENKQVSAKHAELAERVEAAITAPAPDWKTKWTQLQKARSDLLTAERDALTSTAPGRTKTAADMRALADTVRTQQEKAAKYVFGEKDGEKFMGYLKTLDTRYRRLMEATNNGNLAGAAALKGEAGRDAERKFVAFAHDDPQAIAAYQAMRRGGSNVENDVRTLVGMEKVPYIGHVVTWAKMAGRMREWAQERAAGSPVKFSDMVRLPGFFESNKPLRDLLGTVAQRGATM